MKRLIAIILFQIILFSSCVTYKTYITDYNEQMRILRTSFPEIYDLYRQGDAVIVHIYEYKTEEGISRYRVRWRYR